MKVLITGGAGFIGSHLIERLLKENLDITVLDNFLTIDSTYEKQVKFVKMDVADPLLYSLFEENKFDVVVHLATQIIPINSPDYDANKNILGGIWGGVNILECCKKTNVKKIIFPSTAAVYGNSDIVPSREDLPTEPNSFYGLSKLTFEKYLMLYNKLFNLDYVALRFSNVYGERQRPDGPGSVISTFINHFIDETQITIYGDGSQTRDFIYVGDIAESIWAAIKTNEVNDVYNISTNIATEVNAVLAILADISGKKISVVRNPERIGDIYHSTLDNSKAINKLKWKPETTIRFGLEKVYKSFLKGVLFCN